MSGPVQFAQQFVDMADYTVHYDDGSTVLLSACVGSDKEKTLSILSELYFYLYRIYIFKSNFIEYIKNTFLPL